MLPPIAIAAVALSLLLDAAPLDEQSAPPAPSQKQLEAAVARYLELDPKLRAGRTEQLAILREIERAPAPTRAELAAWAKRFARLQPKLRKLEKSSGRHFWWEKEERGLYVIAGETKRPKGLFLGMHGGGVGSGDAGLSAGSHGPAAGQLDWVGIFPEVLEKTEHGWTDSGTEEWVLDLVDAAMRTWDIDPARVYAGGHSMGGYGTWVLGAHHADRFAGLCPSAGAPTPYMNKDEKVEGIMDGVVPNLRNVPLIVWQSLDDAQVPPDANQFANRAVLAARERWGGFANYVYREVDGFGHGLPHKGAIELMEPLARFEREPHPEIVVWQPALSWKRQFYWLAWEDPRIGSTVHARLDRKANSIQVDVEGASNGLCVLLSDELVDMGREVTVRLGKEGSGSEVAFQGVPVRSLATWVDTAATCDPGRAYCTRIRLGN